MKDLLIIILAVFLGFCGSSFTAIEPFVSLVSHLFIHALKLIGLPLVFFSIASSLSEMGSVGELKSLAKSVVFYTLLTTVFAALVALSFFLLIDPAGVQLSFKGGLSSNFAFGKWFSNIIPENFFSAFIENNVLAVALMAFALGLSTLVLEEKHKLFLRSFFSAFFAILLRIAGGIACFVPLAVFAFSYQLAQSIQSKEADIHLLFLYFLTVILANLFQGLVVLPALLLLKGLSPFACFRSFLPALTIAFFTRSSAAALPTTLHCARDRAVSKKVADFTLPLCSVVNMNACAAFILITVLFVSSLAGASYSCLELLIWVFVATLAALGNAGVPMGCYFLASAFLAGMDVPLEVMGLILSIYPFIDMLETALNVWSDSCITCLIDKSYQEES